MDTVGPILLQTILARLCAKGLISEATRAGAVDLIHSAGDIPPLLRHPAIPAEGADEHGHPKDPQRDADGQNDL